MTTRNEKRPTPNPQQMPAVIQVSNLSKIYRLGEIGTGTISRDLERWYKMKIRGQEDPFLKIGETNERSKKGVSDVVYALRDINFEVKQGEALGIIGKNGAGKSTLLKILSRVTSPTTGKIKIKGRVASLLEVGTGFHPELTGRENIYLNGAILGMRKKEITRKLDEIIDFSGVERYIDTPVKRYSSGMYVRLAFAVAAHLESEIMIVDEVLAVGDAEFQKKCIGKMGEVSKGEGRTVLFVSHNMGAIEALCDRGLLISDGMVAFYGDQKEAISQYLVKSQSNAIKPLQSRKDHSGNGLLRIIGISTGLERQPNSGYWQTGETCLVRFKYQTVNDIAFDQVDIGLAIEDTGGRKLLYANTIITKKQIMLNSFSGAIYCRIEKFPLSLGDYFLSYDVYNNGQLLDKVQHAALITVEARDGIETWASWGGYGTVCAKYQWGTDEIDTGYKT